MKYLPAVLLLAIGIVHLTCRSSSEIELRSGLTLQSSSTIKAGTYLLPGADSIDTPLITIEGDNVTIDFNHAELIGSDRMDQPHYFRGLAIKVINGKNITIKNAVIRGFKVGILAEGVDQIQLINCDLSYNYRQKLRSTWEKEDEADWMSYHHNEQDEWLRYGAAVYLKNCDGALVKDLRVTGGQNGLLMVGCNQGLFYNNNISFNSGLGIGLYRSSHNRIMHNKLDWNIRGFVFERYNRGQDSSGLLAYEQSSNNVFAYNSATHSGDGIFLWAGQSTMDSGKGGCNDNVIFANDFSYASNNGVEITFSRGNQILNNRLESCDYGIWGGYSYEMYIAGNTIRDNRVGLAIEHGQDNRVIQNLFSRNTTAIRLWERPQQPGSWGFAALRNVDSKNYQLLNNYFLSENQPFDIKQTRHIRIRGNYFIDSAVKTDTLHPSNKLRADSVHRSELNYKIRNPELVVEPLPDGMDTRLDSSLLSGRKYILIDSLGPFNFEYPAIWLRNIEGNNFTFAILGPPGNWKLTGGAGFEQVSRKTGSIPATLTAVKSPDADGALHIRLEFIGAATKSPFGEFLDQGSPYRFSWRSP